MKLIINKDSAIVFNVNQTEVKEFISIVQKEIKLNTTTTSSNTSSTITIISPVYEPEPFEHIIIESVLNVVCDSLYKQVKILSPSVETALASLTTRSANGEGAVDKFLHRQEYFLLPIKNKLDELMKRVKETKRIIINILQAVDNVTISMDGSVSSPHDKSKDGGVPGASSSASRSSYKSNLVMILEVVILTIYYVLFYILYCIFRTMSMKSSG
jgi:hypothetical protein